MAFHKNRKLILDFFAMVLIIFTIRYFFTLINYSLRYFFKTGTYLYWKEWGSDTIV